jgi:hypothetical protein
MFSAKGSGRASEITLAAYGFFAERTAKKKSEARSPKPEIRNKEERSVRMTETSKKASFQHVRNSSFRFVSNCEI